MSYEPHQRLIAPARPSRDLRKLILGSVLLVAVFVVLNVALSAFLAGLVSASARDDYLIELMSGSTAPTAILNLFSFALMMLALWLALLVVHRRGFLDLIGDPRRALGQFRRVTVALIVLYAAVTLVLPTPDGLEMTPNLPAYLWLLLLPISLVGLLIQVSAEELVFRGYLQSQLAARFAHPAIWMGIPSVLFALLHFDGYSDPLYAWSVVLWAGLFGLATADLTARSGTLGPAIAMHLVNNFAAILLTAQEGYFDGLALYSVPLDDSDPALILTLMPLELGMLLCSWLAARLALRR